MWEQILPSGKRNALRVRAANLIATVKCATGASWLTCHLLPQTDSACSTVPIRTRTQDQSRSQANRKDGKRSLARCRIEHLCGDGRRINPARTQKLGWQVETHTTITWRTEVPAIARARSIPIFPDASTTSLGWCRSTKHRRSESVIVYGSPSLSMTIPPGCAWAAM